MTNLRKKTIAGLIWTFSQQFGIQLVNFIVSIILARILLPEEFGLIGMIAVFIAIGKSLVNSGMSSSLIRSKDVNDVDYSTVFYSNLVISFFVYILTYILSPYIADFFNQPILEPLLKVYCLVFIINAFSTVQSTKLNKEMDFKTQFIINIPSLIIASLLGIYLAYEGFGVWSLVWMQLTQIVLATLQLWIHSRWKPLLRFDKAKFRKHFGFGYKLTLSGILNSIISNIYNIIIGKMFPPAQLGFFIRAKSLQELPVNNITLALNKVTYPMFASISDDNLQLKRVYKKLMKQIFFCITPILIVSILIAEPLFRVLLTDKWLPSVPYFQILCIAGMVTPLNLYNLNILLVKGKSGKYFRLESFKSLLIIFGTLLVIPFGIYGMLWGILITSYITFFVNASFCGRIISFTVYEQLKSLFPILVLGVLVGFVGFLIKDIIYSLLNNDLIFIMTMTGILFSIYIIGSYFFKISALKEFKVLFKK